MMNQAGLDSVGGAAEAQSCYFFTFTRLHHFERGAVNCPSNEMSKKRGRCQPAAAGAEASFFLCLGFK